MKRIFFVVFYLLLSNSCYADSLLGRLQPIEYRWEQLNSSNDKVEKLSRYPELEKQAIQLVQIFPNRAEPLILQACIILTQAELQGPFKALSSVKKARDLLMQAIAINPYANKGSAVVTMGVLYYKVPGWPIAFGDNKKAEKFLLRALKINPQGIDSNYFYADYLISQSKLGLAAKYLHKAASVPVHSGLSRTSLELRSKAKHALQGIQALMVKKGTDLTLSLASPQ